MIWCVEFYGSSLDKELGTICGKRKFYVEDEARKFLENLPYGGYVYKEEV